MSCKKNRAQGFSLLELILAIALFMIFSAGLSGTAIGGYLTSFENARMVRANGLLVEGWEAVKSIRNGAWSDMTNGSHGLAVLEGRWIFSGILDEHDGFTRVVTVQDVLRDDLGAIVLSGADADPDTKRISIELSWDDSGDQRRMLYTESFLSNYANPAVWPKPAPEPAPEP